MSQIGMELCGFQDMPRFIASCLPSKDGTPGRGVQMLKRLAKNQFFIKHRGQIQGAEATKWTIKRISPKNAKTFQFECLNKQTGVKEMTTVFDYYLKKYNVRLDKWQLPLLETQKKNVLFPMELAIMAPSQRYPFKLNEEQVC